MSVLRINFTRELVLFVPHKILLSYNELPEDNRPMFVEYVEQKYPSVYAEWVASMAKRRLTE